MAPWMMVESGVTEHENRTTGEFPSAEEDTESEF